MQIENVMLINPKGDPVEDAKDRLLSSAAICKAYSRAKNPTIKTNILYMPQLRNQAVGPQFDSFRAASEGDLVLISYHHAIIEHSMELYNFPFKLTLNNLIESLTKWISTNLDVDQAYSLVLSIEASSTIAIKAIQVDLKRDFFSGISEIQKARRHYYLVYLDSKVSLISPNPAYETECESLIRFQDLNNKIYASGNISNEEEKLYDVVLVNSDNQLMSGCKSLVAFHRDGHWCVPPLDSGRKNDALCAFFLKQGFLREKEVFSHELQHHEEVLVFNSVLGLTRGFIQLLTPDGSIATPPTKKRVHKRVHHQELCQD